MPLLPFSLAIWLLRNSRVTRSVQMMARRKDPRAREPWLYLKAHQNPYLRLNLPLVSCDEVKYHVHTPVIKVYWKTAKMNSIIQKYMNMLM